MGRVREEKRREEKRRREKTREEKESEERVRRKSQKKESEERVRRKNQKKESEERVRRKSQKKEDAGARKDRKVAAHRVFPMICGSGGSKNTLAKAAGAEPSGQMRDEKLHAVVARSTFRSQNVQNAPFAKHFWKLRC